MTGISRVARNIGARSKVASIGAAVGLAASLVVVGVGASPAAAASGCGRKCDGKDPALYAWRYVGPSPGVAEQCSDDAKTIASTSRVLLRYSKNCRTAWAKADGEPAIGAVWYVEVISYNTNGKKRLTEDTSPNDKGYTLMVDDAGITAKACIYWRYSADDPNENSSCTKAL